MKVNIFLVLLLIFLNPMNDLKPRIFDKVLQTALCFVKNALSKFKTTIKYRYKFQRSLLYSSKRNVTGIIRLRRHSPAIVLEIYLAGKGLTNSPRRYS